MPPACRTSRSTSTTRPRPSSCRESEVTSARFPFIDVHNHQFRMGDGQDLSEVTAEMDRAQHGGHGESERARLPPDRESGRHDDASTSTRPSTWRRRSTTPRTNAPGRFVVFTNISVLGIDEPGWTRARGGPARGRRRGRRPGAQDLQGPGSRIQGLLGRADSRRRPATRSGVGEVRRARHPGPHPHRRAGAVLAAARRHQRAPPGDEGAPGAAPRPGRVPELGVDHGRAARRLPQAPGDEFHQRPPRLAGQRPRRGSAR